MVWFGLNSGPRKYISFGVKKKKKKKKKKKILKMTMVKRKQETGHECPDKAL